MPPSASARGKGSAPFSSLIDTRGTFLKVERFIESCAVSQNGQNFLFATSEGDVWLVARKGLKDISSWQQMAVHEGPVLCLSADCKPESFLTGGEDNSLRRIHADGRVEILYTGKRWVEHCTSWVDEKGRNGMIAFASGKEVVLLNPEGKVIKQLSHASTVSGLAFDAKGKRLATSHYNGASLWYVHASEDKPQEYHWKGSHIGVVLHPQGEALVTTMQENELHGWRLSDGHNIRMSGYPRKVHSLSFSRNGKWLATSGADTVVMWPFFGGGPIGKPPVELAGIPGVICNKVAFHPQFDLVAAGFSDGTVFLADTKSDRMMPVSLSTHQLGPVSCLCCSPDGEILMFGTEDGTMAVVDLSLSAVS
ncbi:WD40 repeat domain-containing protein [Entomobacter blattae]|nr:WD40 repeat domain-containing protein [Entomobacter blattae]